LQQAPAPVRAPVPPPARAPAVAPVPAPAIAPKPTPGPARPGVKGDPFEKSKPTRPHGKGKGKGGGLDKGDPFDVQPGKPGAQERKSSPFQ